jgi:protein-export membrane protein SecD
MLRFQPWKTWTVIIACVLGVLLALPNALPHSLLDQLPSWIPAHKVNLGLDLQGGSHLLYEIDMSNVVKDRMDTAVDGLNSELKKAKIDAAKVAEIGDHIAVTPADPADRDRIAPLLPAVDADLQIVPSNAAGEVDIAFTPQSLQARKLKIVEQSVEIIRRRIDETGTKEPTILREGDDRVLVQLPGIEDPEQVKVKIGTTAKLTFHLVDENASLEDAVRGKVPPGDVFLDYDPSARRPGGVVVKRRASVDGADLADARYTTQDNQAVILIKFDSIGGRRFGDLTKENVGHRFAIVLDNKVLSDPVIQEAIPGGSGRITGNFTPESASNLALLLRAGALPAKLNIIEERTVGPDLGADSIRAGTIASLIAMLLVTLFMVAFYGLFGLYADIALVFNLAILLGALSLLGATLTLPGIAGMALTMGMAVDANVLVNERIREEIRGGRTLISAIDNGFSKAYATITDANVTHFIAGAFLFILGSGPVKGFAVTLCLGIATSLFTTMMVTRLFVVWWLRTKPKMLPI